MKTNWSHLEPQRTQFQGYESKEGDTFGWFIWHKGKTQIRAMAVDGTQTGWEHVSVSIFYRVGKKWKPRLPSWDEMCWVKSLFFEAEECVVEYHPPEKNYVNLSTNCLHLWRCVNAEFPMPPTLLV